MIKSLTYLNWVSLLFYLFFSYKIIQEDLQKYKISNTLLLKMIRLLIIITITFIMIGQYYSLDFTLVFMKMYIVHIILSFIGGYVLWYSDYWPGGDAKYYILSMAFLPFMMNFFTSSKYYPYHLWLVCLVNVFTISFLYLIVKFVVDFLYMDKNKIMYQENIFDILNKAIEKSSIMNILENIFKIIFFFLFGKFINVFFKNLIISLFERPEFICFLIFFLWNDIEEKILNKKIYYQIISIFYIIYFISMIIFKADLLFSHLVFSLKYTTITIILLTFFKKILNKIISFSSTEFLKLSDIKEGMFLSDNELNKIKQLAPDLYNNGFKDYDTITGLKKSHIEILNKFVFLLNLNKIDFEVYKIKSFSFWIFLGCILQAVFNLNLLQLFGFILKI